MHLIPKPYCFSLSIQAINMLQLSVSLIKLNSTNGEGLSAIGGVNWRWILEITPVCQSISAQTYGQDIALKLQGEVYVLKCQYWIFK